MRELTATLKAAQQHGALNPLYKIVLTKGEDSYTYDNKRILPSEHDEAMYSHTAKIVLNNRDKELNDKNLKGYDAVISYGVVSSAGEEYSTAAPLIVIDQQFDSDPNKLTCTLELEGMPNLMSEDEASEAYQPDADDTKTVKTLVNEIAGATLAPFTHCHAFEVVWDDGYDDLADKYQPKDSFRIYTKSSRLAALRRVLDFTANVPRFENDGKIHILKPVTSGDNFDAEYSLQRGQHQFFSKAYKETLIFPNRIVVESQPDDDPQYSGEATIDGYASLPAKVKKTEFVQLRLESNDQATSIGEALIAKAEMGASRGQAEIRINVGSEVFDYIKVTDQRQGDTRTGNLGYIHRRFGKDKWVMTFGFGNWLTSLRYQKMLKELETYTDAGQYFNRLIVGDLNAEHILADNVDFVWIDPDNTIDLSQIGDTLDNLPDGEVYARVKTLHLDAGQIKLDENIIYSSGYNPTEKFDLNLDDLDDIPDGTVFQRAKSAALTADGLVVLDNVVVGTYDLLLATDISAGHALLSKTVKDGNWYEESGVVIDATYGIALYGGEGINAFRTFADADAYEAGTPVQVYIGTDGKLYAGGGDVWLDDDGVSFKGARAKFYYGSTCIGRIEVDQDSPHNLVIVAADQVNHNSLELKALSGDIILHPMGAYPTKVVPSSDGHVSLGESDKQFYGGYFSDRLKCPVGTDMYD